MNNLPGNKFNPMLLKNPPLECEVTYSWLWNEPITREGIDERLLGFVEAGIKSLYILPLPKDFRPETLRTSLEPEYLSEEFFDLLSYAIRKCVELGIKPWIYDEGGWPSGAAGRRTEMQYKDAPVRLLGKREITLKAGERFVGDENFIALFDRKVRLDDDYTASYETTLTEYYVRYDAPNPYFIDFTDPKVTDTFLENTYEGYKSAVGDLFGDVIPLFFTDEPGLARYTLPKRIFEEYSERYGYDLRDLIYVIFDDGLISGSFEEEARINYFEYVGELFYKNTFKKIADWCCENGVAYSGHLMSDNYPDSCRNGYLSLLDVLRTMHIPGVDVIWEQIRVPQGGALPYDEESKNMPFFPRIAASAARQAGRNLALTETYSIYGDGISPDEMRYVSNYQAVRGINVFNFLTLPYGKERCSALMMRPAFCPEKPGFLNLRHINEYYARLAYLLRLGYPEGDTALYIPSRDYMASQKTIACAQRSFADAGMKLENENVPFDLIDDKGIREAKEISGALVLGNATYRHIVIPSARYMPKDVREKAEKYQGLGKPSLKLKSPNLRVYTRKLDTGRLYFIFNESDKAIKEKIKIPGEHLYSIDATSGELYPASLDTEILSGDIHIYLSTDEEYSQAPSRVDYEVYATLGEPTHTRQFKIGYNKIYSVEYDGAPTLSDGFSGEVSYEAEYTLPKEPSADERYRITLIDFAVTASVTLSDECHTLGMSPMSFTVSGDRLEKRGSFTVTVCNTAADEIIAKDDVIRSHPKAEVGVYHDKCLSFESRRYPMKIGKIRIEKLVY